MAYLKTLKCDLCEITERGETFEEWIKELHQHYMEVHPEAMNKISHSREDKQKWIIENKARFDAA